MVWRVCRGSQLLRLCPIEGRLDATRANGSAARQCAFWKLPQSTLLECGGTGKRGHGPPCSRSPPIRGLGRRVHLKRLAIDRPCQASAAIQIMAPLEMPNFDLCQGNNLQRKWSSTGNIAVRCMRASIAAALMTPFAISAHRSTADDYCQ